MTALMAAAATFLLMHLLISGTRVRDALVGRIGQGAYMGVFSLASVAALAWLIFAYGMGRGAPSNAVLWSSTPQTRAVQLVIQLIAFLLIVPGLTTPNPTTVGQQGVLDKPDAARGMLRITRHPFLWGVAVWAAGHLLVHGTLAGLVLFGSLLILALLGTTSIDAKRRRALGNRWAAFAAKTSNLPFAAIAAGRQSLKLAEIGWWRILLAIVLWAATIGAHPYAFGISPLP